MTRQIRETAEVSLRTFVEAVSKAEAAGKPADKADKQGGEEIEQACVKEERKAEETKGKIESRLRFLVRMHEPKKAKQTGVETMAENTGAVEE